MVRVRRSDPIIHQESSIRETPHRIRRNRRTRRRVASRRRLPCTRVLLPNEIITPTPAVIKTNLQTSEDPLSPSVPEPEEYTEIQENINVWIETFAPTTPPTENHYTVLETTEDFSDNLSNCSTVRLQRFPYSKGFGSLGAKR